MSLDEDEIWVQYSGDATEALRDIEESLLALEAEPGKKAHVNRLYRGLHTLKGNSGFMRLACIERLAHVSEDMIGLVRDQGVRFDDAMADLMLQVIDRLREVVHAAEREHKDAQESQVADLVAQVTAMRDDRAAGGTGPVADTTPTATTAPEAPAFTPTLAAVPPEPVDEEPFQFTAIDPTQDPGYIEVFLSLGSETLPKLSNAVYGLMQTEGADAARAQIAELTDELGLAAERMGYVHVGDSLAKLSTAVATGGSALAATPMLELDLCWALVGIEEHYRTLTQTPTEFGLISLYRRACANMAFGDLARLHSILEGAAVSDEQEMSGLFRRLRVSCEYYGFASGTRTCLDLEDLFCRASESDAPPSTALVAVATEFLENLGRTIHAVNAGEEVFDVPVPEAPDDPMKFSAETTTLPVSPQIRAQLTRTALGAITRLLAEGRGIFEVQADLDRDERLAEAFNDWLGRSGAVFISSAVVAGPDGVMGYRFLLGAEPSLAAMQKAFAALPAAHHLQVARLDQVDAGARAPSPAAPSPAPTARVAASAPTPAPAPRASAPSTTAGPIPVVDATPAAASEPESSGESSDDSHAAHKTEFLRIDARKVSQIMDLAGEIGLACGAVTHHPGLVGSELEGFSAAAHKLEMLIRELQNEVSGMRLVPVAGVFQKMKRVVRDTARRTGKKVELVLVGEETEIDKVMVDSIQDPLVHMLRNSIDHGLESPEEREAAGKSATGRIVLEASHQGGEISIQVSDDGRGLNRERILARARERKLVPEGVPMSDDKIDELIFLPGFSTKETIDELSGRGVGMDVIKTTIDGLRGRVHLKSTPGRGTRVNITVPLTLAFVEAMVVRERDRLFALPIEKVFEVFKASHEQLAHSSADGTTSIRVRDHLIPVCWLHRFYGEPGEHEENLDGRVVVVVQTAQGGLALPVDTLLGNQQVMLKPLRGVLSGVRAAAGCGMLRSGDVALALDCERLHV